MPQGFPDPYSAFSESFRGSFFPTMQLITEADREKRLAAERKQEAQRKKEAADNKTVMNAVHLYQQGMTDLAVKMAESTGKFAKGEAAAGFKQLNQLPEEWKKAIGEMSADDPVTAAVFGRYMKMDPKVSGPFVLQILKNWQEQKGKTDTKKFLEDEIRRAGGGGAAAGPAPVAPGTALAQSGAQAAPAPEFQGTEAGGRGSTALAQRLLEARPATAPSAVPAAPAIPGAPAATPPATDLSSLDSAALRRIQAKLIQRGGKPDVALAEKIGVLAKSAEDREGKAQPKVGRYHVFGKGGVIDTISGEITRQPSDQTEAKTINMGQGILGIVQQGGKNIEFIQAPQFRESSQKPFSVGQGIVAVPQPDGSLKFEQAPQFQTERTKPFSVGQGIVALPQKDGSLKFEQAPSFIKQETPEEKKKRELETAEEKKKIGLKYIREESYERAMGAIKAQAGQPKSPLGKMLFDRDAAKKAGDKAAVTQHEAAIENYLTDVKKDTLAALTAYKEGRYGDVKPYLSGIPVDELRAMSIDPTRAMMGMLGQKKEETGRAGPTMRQLADSDRKIQRMIRALPSATDKDLQDTLVDKEGTLSGFPKEQKERVIKLIRDEMKARAERKKKAGARVR